MSGLSGEYTLDTSLCLTCLLILLLTYYFDIMSLPKSSNYNAC